jgi:DNA-binding Lrp family transcriptional regulator
MIFVYILGKVETGREMDVLNSFKNFDPVIRATVTYGTYDLFIEAQFETMEELDDFIFNVVRKTNGITDTVTLVAARMLKKD